MSEKKGVRCAKCSSMAKPVKTSFQGEKIDGWKCKKCGELYYDPSQAERILTLHKLQHEEIEAKLGRIKSNLIVRVPKIIEKILEFREGEKIKLRIKNAHELVITPA